MADVDGTDLERVAPDGLAGLELNDVQPKQSFPYTRFIERITSAIPGGP